MYVLYKFSNTLDNCTSEVFSLMSHSGLNDKNILFGLKNPPDWQEILLYFRGSELQNYFTKILEDDLKVCDVRF